MKNNGNKKFQLGKWLDDHLLLFLSMFLLAFIPLYPKLPLFDIIPGYIVRVRLEDIFVFVILLIWLYKVWKKKLQWQSSVNPLIGAYGIAGACSIISAIFIIKTIPFEPLHIGKSVLHYVRYLEYFSVVYIFFSSIKTRKDIKIIIATLIATVFAIGFYGIGQKYLYWPVYSTMNREFSKGIRLILTDHARVQSTFGGHYDLAAYSVVILPILIALALTTHKKLSAVAYWSATLLGIWLLVVSGARSSFAAYTASVVVVVALLAYKKGEFKQQLLWMLKKGTIMFALTLAVFLTFGDDMYERFLQTLEGYPSLHRQYHELNDQRKKIIYQFVLEPLALSSFSVERPENSITTDDALVMVASDQQPKPSENQDDTVPSDVYVNVPVLTPVATVAADGTETITLIETERTYSENALRHGLSLAIRLDTLWPQAIAGFQKNPLFGSGYATLNKENLYHFTEADSTDNNFLRTLGETGLFGFITFYGIILFMMHQAYRLQKMHKFGTLESALAIGYIGASLGLLLNALYIDVFAASKVAFTYWSLTGVFLALYEKENRKISKGKT